MTINSRAKGAAGERELAECFRSMGYSARRSQQYSGADATSDLLVEELPGVLVECKRVQRLNIEEAMQKAASDAAPHLKTPMICHRKNGSEWLVTIRMKDLHTFVERMQRGMARRSTNPAPEVK
jgi:Holliday junction resolvase